MRGPFHIKIAKSWHDRSSTGFVRSKSPCVRADADVGRFGATLHGMRICNPFVTKRIGMAARSKALMLRRSWQAGLQLEVAKRIDHSEQLEVGGCAKRRIGSAEATEELSGRQVSSRSSPDKWLLREEVAERRGASAKRSLSEDALKDKQLTHPSVHPSIHHASIHPSCNSFIGSFIRSFTDSLIH